MMNSHLSSTPALHPQPIQIPLRQGQLNGDLAIPVEAKGIVVFAHGSGSSRLSPRNRAVADFLNRAGLATLLVDLLTEDEEAVDAVDRSLRFDIALLADRLRSATEWVRQNRQTQDLRIGYFGASTGAAAALVAARDSAGLIDAVVSRGGRPDLAGASLEAIRCPILLIVGGNDALVIDLNREALDRLPAGIEKRMEIVPGASHLFEEPGTLERVAELAGDWFLAHLQASR